MSDNQVNLIVKILLDEEENLSDGFNHYTPSGEKNIYLGEIAKLILTKLKQQQEEEAEVKNKKQEERDKGINPYESCSGCYRPNMACKC